MTTTTLVRTNLCNNPNPDSVTGWGTSSSYVRTYNPTTYGMPAMVCTRSASGPSSYIWYGRNAGTLGTSTGTPTSVGGLMPCNPGDVVTAGIMMGTTSSNAHGWLLIRWFDGTGTQTGSTTTGTTLNFTAGQWQQFTVTATAPATAAYFYLENVVQLITGNTVGGEIAYAGQCWAFTNATNTSYFDGDTGAAVAPGYSPAGSYTYAWTGTPGQSTSTETLTIPLQDYQVQLPTGAIVGAGTNVGLTSISGLRDLAALRSGDANRGQSDGAFGGLNLLGERPVQIQWELTTPTGGVETGLQTLAAAFQNIQDPSTVCMTGGDYLRQVAGVGAQLPVSMLQFQLPGRPYPLVLFGRPSKYNPPIDQNYQYGRVQAASEWTSPDGVIYDLNVQQDSCGLPTPAAGLSWPAAWPWTWGASTSGGLSLNNPGSYQAAPLFVLRGPMSYPIIGNNNTGAFIKLNMALAATDVVVIDHQAGIVTLNGTANRNGIVTVGSSFFHCSPGITGIDFTTGDATFVAGTLTGYLLPTYSAV